MNKLAPTTGEGLVRGNGSGCGGDIDLGGFSGSGDYCFGGGDPNSSVDYYGRGFSIGCGGGGGEDFIGDGGGCGSGVGYSGLGDGEGSGNGDGDGYGEDGEAWH